MASQPLPDKFDLALYRGDSRLWTHYFNEAPPDWAASTAYVQGIVGTGPIGWIADSTVTRNGVKYTCISAHTSADTFDAANWTADPKAVGEPIDITGWIFESTYRLTPDTADDIAVEDCEVINGPGGIMRRTLTTEQSALLPAGRVAWDLQAAKPDDTVRTYLYNDGVKVRGDVTR